MTPDTPARTDGDLPTQQPSRDDARPNASPAPGEGAATEAADRQAAAPEPAAGGDAERRIAEAERRLAETHESYLRAVAETENVRRRAQEEVARAQKFGIESFAESLLPVKDSLELALAADAPDVENMKEGVGATLRLLTSAFEKNRLVEIDPRGQKFDPNLHQAISTVPASGTQPPVAPGHVAHVLQKGYLIADRVLRPALVTVVQD
ncbi:MAG: nucleotide exchange factor GrpE [Burkholderiaceae bacterium]|nr:nucleotide exchange factor GrpE [Burkholderiaceae bacterium]